jgi:hypothetical protein
MTPIRLADRSLLGAAAQEPTRHAAAGIMGLGGAGLSGDEWLARLGR